MQRKREAELVFKSHSFSQFLHTKLKLLHQPWNVETTRFQRKLKRQCFTVTAKKAVKILTPIFAEKNYRFFSSITVFEKFEKVSFYRKNQLIKYEHNSTKISPDHQNKCEQDLAKMQNEAFWGDFQTLCISVMARIHTCKRIEMRGGASLISNLVYKHNRFPFV